MILNSCRKTFTLKQLQEFQPRYGFKELLNLNITFLEGVLKNIYFLELLVVFIKLDEWQKPYIP